MRILLVSALPEILDLAGLRHHHPAAPADPAGGTTVTRVGDSVVADVDALLGGLPGAGPVVAHLSGISAALLRIARDLAKRNVPIVYSPLPASLPAWPERLASSLTGIRGEAAKEMEAAGNIAALSAAIAVRDPSLAEVIGDAKGFRGRKVYAVPAPRAEEGRAGAYSNLAVAFCDTISPEWNVHLLVPALGKINVDAAIVARPTDSAYARSCIGAASENPRIRFVILGAGGAGGGAGEARSLLRKASVVVDPSRRGLAGIAAAAAAASGTPAVVSRLAAVARVAAGRGPVAGTGAGGAGLFTFEPSSWELLNHALTLAFNAASGAAGVTDRSSSGPGPNAAPTPDNAELAGMFLGIYREVTGP